MINNAQWLPKCDASNRNKKSYLHKNNDICNVIKCAKFNPTG